MQRSLQTCVQDHLTTKIDIFLPSYLDYDSSDLEHRSDPVQEIILTDEEVAAMFPK
jgi:hypothetical protein